VTRLLAIGDVVGKTGRRCLDLALNLAHKKYSPDIVLANGENAAGGFGLTEKIYHYFTEQLAIDCITMGNHWHDKREIYNYLSKADRLVLPANMANVSDENNGLKVIRSHSGKEFAAINLIGQAFMHGENRNPFQAADRLVAKIPAGTKVRIVDMHAEASSEKQGIARYLTGQVSLVYGTHSHVQTADERILSSKTGYLTDIGMTGAYDSVIGMQEEAALQRMITGKKGKSFEPAKGDPWFCFLVADLDPDTGFCQKIERLCWRLNEMELS